MSQDAHPVIAMSDDRRISYHVVAVEVVAGGRSSRPDKPVGALVRLHNHEHGSEIVMGFTVEPEDRCPRIGDRVQVTFHVDTADWHRGDV